MGVASGKGSLEQVCLVTLGVEIVRRLEGGWYGVQGGREMSSGRCGCGRSVDERIRWVLWC